MISKAWSHERQTGKDEWLTPRFILAALGPFDLDPCASVVRPWDTAAHHLTAEDDGLAAPWSGRVWMNPPYGNKTHLWLKRLAEHGDGVALIFARTDTRMFFDYIFERADAVMFLKGRLSFCDTRGVAAGPAGAASCLVAYGAPNVDALRSSGLNGRVLALTQQAPATRAAGTSERGR